MKVNYNGVDREMAPAEAEAFAAERKKWEQESHTTPPTNTERIAQMEKSNAEMAEELRAAKILLGLEE